MRISSAWVYFKRLDLHLGVGNGGEGQEHVVADGQRVRLVGEVQYEEHDHDHRHVGEPAAEGQWQEACASMGQHGLALVSMSQQPKGSGKRPVSAWVSMGQHAPAWVRARRKGNLVYIFNTILVQHMTLATQRARKIRCAAHASKHVGGRFKSWCGLEGSPLHLKSRCGWKEAPSPSSHAGRKPGKGQRILGLYVTHTKHRGVTNQVHFLQASQPRKGRGKRPAIALPFAPSSQGRGKRPAIALPFAPPPQGVEYFFKIIR